MLRLLLLFLGLSAAGVAGDLSLERLFSRPFLWGSSPQQPAWSKDGHTLLFLWNAGGYRFLDLYAYHPDAQRLARLTGLEGEKDEINLSAEERDDRQKLYLAPPSGLADFELSRNGSLAAFSYRGDLYVVPTDGSRPPFRLTKTKAAETAPQAWLRQCGRARSAPRGGAKQLFLDVLSIAFRRKARALGVATNPAFSGAYDFGGKRAFATVFARFLEGLPDGGLVMCHPGHVDTELKRLDPVTQQREREFAFFSSDEFPKLLIARGLALAAA